MIDLAVPAQVRAARYELPSGRGGYRLVLDLAPVDRETFAAAVQPWTPSGSQLRVAAPTEVIPQSPPPIAAPLPAIPLAAQPNLPTPPPPAPRAAEPQAVAAGPSSAEPPRSAHRRADNRRVVVLDPGHGGVDPGATGASGTFEKDITLAVAREVRRHLEATGRYRVVMTRNEDEFVRLRDRVAKARVVEADLFLSIHADSLGDARTRGASIYTLSETASDAEAAALAARENRADIIAGIDLSHENKDVASILIDLAQRETMNHSATLAGILVAELGRDLPLIPTKPHRFAGFAVLKAPDVPSALIELGYISNRHDESLLNRPQHRAKIAAAVVRAVDRYFARRLTKS
ncbi:MAG: N-acetylmuramoyl-L-alanine amidase [Rhodospirillales bacterium]|nr:N-acetylmuramoyl-L-alanine amidase [Rhodospirillales bacterium]